MVTVQEENWGGEHGQEYTKRNPQGIEGMDALYQQNFGIARGELNLDFLDILPRSIKILEVGSNVGVQLMFLQKMGFTRLFGVEINREAINLAKSLTKDIDIIQGSAMDIPFKDCYFDLVFTSGVLIHIAPQNVRKIMEEIHRCSKKYIWGFEYYASEYTEILYRGKTNMLWKADFCKMYQDYFPGLTLIKEKKVKYLDSDNQDSMFLLEKN